MTEVTKHIEALREAKENVDTAASQGRWMTAAWHVDENNVVHLSRVSMDFPLGAMRVALSTLRDNLAETILGPTPQPLPLADLRRPAEHPIIQVGGPDPFGNGELGG